MDKPTRNEIAGATQRARRLLEEDISSQLEGTFDILQSGAIAPTGGPHLSQHQRFDREKIVAAIDHKRAAGMPPPAAVSDYVRDAAFTTLNRFVALKMLEARELVQECISKGEQSSGYKEFCGMAPGLALLPDSAGYRIYIESLFDELSIEVKVLFDRRDLASIIWPRRAAFEALLSVLNTPELATVWAEDETLGWVYQYFNGQDERRKMRDESPAPRNSRELAVRNQFFTPRYVVEFLTDNTLGRIWYEMRGGKTRLAERCEYLVRRSNETWEPRSKKDPRDLKILDPACGSGHFLLYSFDLLLVIYEEGWADPDAPPSALTGRSLREDYPNLEALRSAVPGLILRHNLHGIDIDPRCAQIGQLSLWMRAQRAFRDYGITRSDRPAIRRANIVIAEPMPGERDLLEEFLRNLKEDRLEGLLRRALDIPADRTIRATKAMADSLAELVTAVWNSMRLAGEMGSLLKIDRALESAIQRGRAEWEDRLPLFRVAEYGLEHGRVAPVKETYVRVVPGEQEDFWSKAEQLVFQALADYANSTNASDVTRRRLFVDDAAQGFAFADLITNRFDVVLMNPPFGDPSVRSNADLARDYIAAKHDVASAFLERACSLLSDNGLTGAIVTRTIFFLQYLRLWRERFLFKEIRMICFADLGIGVLDAMVETALVCFRRKGDEVNPTPTAFVAANRDTDRASRLLDFSTNSTDAHIIDQDRLTAIPGSPLAFALPDSVLQLFGCAQRIETNDRQAFTGALTQDDFRFVRAWWEISPVFTGRSWTSGTTARWVPYVSGGSYTPIYADVPNVLNWANDGHELKAYLSAYRASKGFSDQWTSQLNSYGQYFRPGLVWSLRPLNQGSFWLLPQGCIFGNNAPALIHHHASDAVWMCGLLNSSIFRAILGFLMPRGNAGTATLKYNLGYVRSVPVPDLTDDLRKGLSSITTEIWRRLQGADACNETSHAFTGIQNRGDANQAAKELSDLTACFSRLEDLVASAYDFGEDVCRELITETGVTPTDQNISSNPIIAFARKADDIFYKLEFFVGRVFGRWKSKTMNDYAEVSTAACVAPVPVLPSMVVSETSVQP